MDKPILFFDNEENNWINSKNGKQDMAIHSEQVAFIPIDNTRHNNLITAIASDANQAYLQHFLDNNNTYAKFIDTNPNKNKQYLDKDHVNNGITREQVAQLDSWLTIHDNMERSAIFFDWDRTITCVEGMVTDGLLESLQTNTITYNDLLVFLMGGEERLQMIKDMFQNIIRHNIKFFILTHNPYASINKPTRPIYIKLIVMLTQLTESDINSLLFSSIDYPGFKKANSACYINEIIKAILPKCEEILNQLITNKVRTNKKAIKVNKPIVSKGGKRSRRTRRVRRTYKVKQSKKRKTKKRKFYLLSVEGLKN